MSVLLNSTSDSESSMSQEVPELPEVPEEISDLSQNQDETLDLQLGLNALSGLNHVRACAATEQSNRRFDERNHRMHETRMKAMGMEGEEQKPEAEDMSQQVLIRSPVHNHNYYPSTAKERSTVTEPTVNKGTGLSRLAKLAIGTAIAAGTVGTGVGIVALLKPNGDSSSTTNITQGTETGVGLVPPPPPVRKDGP